MPKVSVILPNFNHEKYLDKRITSILKQTYTDFELIILDDASTDGSMLVVKKHLHHPKISECIINEKNSGSTFVQWAKGLAVAKGSYIWIAESDDMADPEFLSKVMHAFEQNEALGLVYVPSIWIDETDTEIHQPSHEQISATWKGDELLKNDFLKGNLIYNASSAVFKKELSRKVNLALLTQYKYAGDWLFWVQLITHSEVQRLGERLNYFRRHPNNVSFASDAEGLQFIEGLKVIKTIFKTQKIGFWQKRKTMAHLAKKIKDTNLTAKKDVLKNMPFEIKIWHAILKFKS